MARNLAGLEANLRFMSSPAGKRELYDRIGQRLVALMQQEWDTQSDAHGNPWAPTTRPNPILFDSGAMSSSKSYEIASNGVTLRVEDVKAAWHQYGTSRGIVPRKMLPDGTLPTAWVVAIQDELTKWTTEVLRR